MAATTSTLASLALLIALACGGGASGQAQPPRPLDRAPPLRADESGPAIAAGRASEAAWFEDARYGMFITWGLYAAPAGTWRGERHYGISEWLMRRAKVPSREWATIAPDFNPKQFDAREWVRLAKAAGFKYIVITAKHHDGFAMYKSKSSAFDLEDATPFRRDPLKELADEARKAGLRIGFYYSQYQDWTDPDAGGNTWEFKTEGRDFQRYLNGKAIPQLKELLSYYGPISIIWFDTPLDLSKPDAQALYDLVKRLQPQALVSSRIGHGLGDYQNYRDSEIPARGEAAKPWEAIFTHNDSWGYSALDQNWKSPTEIIHLLATVSGKGGNLLLNVGPDAEGRLPRGSTDRFKEVGEWLSANGRSVYGTLGSPVGDVPFGAVTRRPGEIYLHVLHRPESGELLVPNVSVEVRDARFLVGGRPLKWRCSGSDLLVTLPDALPDRRNTVIAVRHGGEFKPVPQGAQLLSGDYPETRLDPALARLSGSVEPEKLRHQTYFGVWKHFTSLKGLDGPGDEVVWPLRVTEPGAYRLSLEYSADGKQAGQEGVISTGSANFPFQVLETGTYDPLKPAPLVEHEIGVIEFATSGFHAIALKPVKASGDLFKLKSVKLTPSH